MYASTFTPENAEKEKSSAALSSVFAALLLTALKLGVGLGTNSLGILSEALHSGLDLLAASITFFAVRYASLPPDPGHPYGHGKIENLSAFIESLLLLVTCIWIVWEALDRLFFNPVKVTPSLWAVGVMVLSIIIDISRSRMLLKVAKTHRSQALEADALHFSTDIWSSAVVLFGIGALYLATSLPADSSLAPWLERADAIAALGVSGIVVYVSYSLGKKAINVLLDGGDSVLAEEMRTVIENLPSITKVLNIRLRHSGPDLFVTITLGVDNSLVMDETRQLRMEVESTIQSLAKHATVSIELMPVSIKENDTIAQIRGMAVSHGLMPHAVELFDVKDPKEGIRHLLELHVEVPGAMLLGEAHAKASAFEKQARIALPGLITVTHIEPKPEDNTSSTMLLEAEHIKDTVKQIITDEKDATDLHKMLVRSSADGLYVSFHCRTRADSTVIESHEIASRLQLLLHQRMPELNRIVIHMEPLEECSASLND